jgi:tRNA(Leu) C34 or U34 (ribose-2'-O)-methylase TrmL
MTLKEAVKKLGKNGGEITRKAWYRDKDYDCIEPIKYEWNDIDLTLEDALANDWEVKLKKTIYYFIANRDNNTLTGSFSTFDIKSLNKHKKQFIKWGYKIILEGSKEI